MKKPRKFETNSIEETEKLIADKILSFYQSLSPPQNLPDSVGVLNPYQNAESWKLTFDFYQKFYSDESPRKLLFGINPGRFGCGVTGVPFTDPIALENQCGIQNELPKRTELSSDFIHQMIDAQGGASVFFQRFILSAISPLGFVQNGKNLNYYDIPNWKMIFENYAVDLIKQQLSFNIDISEAYSIGQGDNMKFLTYINDKNGFFKKITALPHPRWVMQYRRKRIDEFIEEYINKLS
ncbi:MAG: DUF4918 family protein [Reichenbachiella sp.]